MAYNANLIPTGMTQKAFVVAETTAGTAVVPTASKGVLLIAPVSNLEQPVPLIDDAQIRYTQSWGAPFQGKRSPGTVTLSCYIKPSGALGTAPEGGLDNLLYGLMGVKTVNASTSVVYTLLPVSSGNMPTFTVWWGDSIESRRMKGCVVTKGTFKLVTDPAGDGSVLQADFELQGLDLRRCVVDQLGSNITATDTTITVTDATKFEVGMLVQINDAGTVDDGTTGYVITGVNTGTNVLTISNVGGVVSPHTASSSVTVEPWLPSITEVGARVHSAIGACTIGGADALMTGMELTVENGVMVPEDIQGTTEFPPAVWIRADKRRISGKISTYARPGIGNLWYKHANLTSVAINAQVNNRTGVDAFKIAQPACYIENPQRNGDKAVKVDIAYRAAFNSSFDNELTLSFAAP